LTNTTATIRLPSHMVGLLTKWRRAERALHRELGQAPTDEQVAVQLGLTDSQLDLVYRARRAGKLQLENAISSDDGAWSPDDAADDREPAASSLESDEIRHELLRRLKMLDERERMVVSLRYGIEGHDALTLKEIGRRLGVTREWVRKIELRAFRKLEAAAEVTNPRPFVEGATASPRRTRRVSSRRPVVPTA
jgi:RNA polymerase primary sigma factor